MSFVFPIFYIFPYRIGSDVLFISIFFVCPLFFCILAKPVTEILVTMHEKININNKVFLHYTTSDIYFLPAFVLNRRTTKYLSAEDLDLALIQISPVAAPDCCLDFMNSHQSHSPYVTRPPRGDRTTVDREWDSEIGHRARRKWRFISRKAGLFILPNISRWPAPRRKPPCKDGGRSAPAVLGSR